MLKAKNILIIFAVNYLVILFVCCFIEIMLISSNAREVQLLMTTAADMALEQVQATDDFFTTGKAGTTLHGYIIGDDGNLKAMNPYNIKVAGLDGKYKEVNIYEAYANSTDLRTIYNKVYNPLDIKKYVEDNPNVLGVDFTVGYTSNSYTGVGGYEYSTLNTTWYKVPVLAQLGNNTHNNVAYKMYDFMGNEINTGVKDEIFKMYDLQSQGKKTVLNGQEIEYFYTPLNVGLTYINEDLLQALFMNNLDLLMRGKYAQRDSYNLNNEDCGFGVLKTAIYSNLVDTKINEASEGLNPINNGSFTLLRGEEMSGTSSEVKLYKGMKPKVEYIVIDMYDDRYNDLLQIVFGAKTVNESGTEVLSTGAEYRKMNEPNILYMQSLTSSSVGNLEAFNHKPIVIAKVTFYADFIIPYMTPGIREMRGRINDGEIMSGRGIINPFMESSTDGNGALSENYVDITTNIDSSKRGYYNGSSTNLGSNSDAFMYTTYFAVTP